MEQGRPVTARPVDFERHKEQIHSIRFRVFVEEQGVPAELEWDVLDPLARHVLAWRGEAAVGTGRILEDGHIGRVAVLAESRGHGIGRRIMAALLQMARERGQRHVWLSSQVQAASFYERLGFSRIGVVYIEAGIKHVDMRLDIDQDP